MIRATVFTMIVALLIGPGFAAQAAEPVATQPAATEPAAVPDDTLLAMYSLLVKRPATRDAEQAIKERTENMDKVLAMGKEVEREFPDAANLAHVHGIMLQAADFLAKVRRDEASTTQLNDLVDRILQSNADVEAKVTADFVRTMHGVQKDGKPTDDAAKQIEAFVGRYKETASAGKAFAFGASLAEMTKLTDLRAQYVSVLKEKFLDDPAVMAFLRGMGEYSDVGKPFTATLTKLDGSTLTLPDDLKGKVVVIDFWATWCPPCRDSVPKLKAFYRTHKDKGVEMVGISLDRTKDDAAKFVKQNNMDWIQTFDGEGNQTAIRYGIQSIPTIFVVGKDGVILSVDARDNLTEAVEKALK